MKSFTVIFIAILQLTPLLLWADQDGEETCRLSGYEWIMKRAEIPMGPGPNIFMPDSVTVNDQSIALNILSAGSRWNCSEIYSRDFFSYGKFELVFSIPRELDSNGVFGFFLYNGQRPPYYNELDFEVSRWGSPVNDSLSFSVQPSGVEGNSLVFEAPVGKKYRCSIDWSRNEVKFMLFDGEGRVINKWTYRGDFVPRGEPSQVHMNLWLFRGDPPRGDGSLKVMLHSFTYKKSN